MIDSTAAAALPPIRYINLDRDERRRIALEAELRRLGLTGERFPAVLWTALPNDAQDAYYSATLNQRQHHLPLVAGEKGCYASHLRLWRWLIDSPYECLIVLEDDVKLENSFVEVCQAIQRLEEPWHMIKLIGRAGLGKREKWLDSRPLVAGHRLVRYRRVPSLTAAYVIHRRGAAALLETRLPFGRPVDVDLRHWWECGEEFRLLGVHPPVIQLAETSLDSSISAELKALPWRRRLRKFALKLSYSIRNIRHRPR